MKLVYQGQLWDGTTALQRAEAFARVPGVEVIKLDIGAPLVRKTSFYRRVRWKLGLPVDELGENAALLRTVAAERPDVVIVDNGKVIWLATLRELRRLGVGRLVYYTPDDVMGRHNRSRPLQASLPEWDVVFTTKTFNVPELQAAGVRRAVLVGKAYDERLHRPLSRVEVGADFERFDLVFAGAHERERRESINALARAGFSVVVYGGVTGGWPIDLVHKAVVMREACFAAGYTEAMHHGRIALCFLRKLNRDRITQRTMEIAAMGRPMLAEKTDEHDSHFRDGEEYVGFTTDDDLIAKARALLADGTLCSRIGRASAIRCQSSGYSSDGRARQMLAAIRGDLQ